MIDPTTENLLQCKGLRVLASSVENSLKWVGEIIGAHQKDLQKVKFIGRPSKH